MLLLLVTWVVFAAGADDLVTTAAAFDAEAVTATAAALTVELTALDTDDTALLTAAAALETALDIAPSNPPDDLLDELLAALLALDDLAVLDDPDDLPDDPDDLPELLLEPDLLPPPEEPPLLAARTGLTFSTVTMNANKISQDSFLLFILLRSFRRTRLMNRKDGCFHPPVVCIVLYSISLISDVFQPIGIIVLVIQGSDPPFAALLN